MKSFRNKDEISFFNLLSVFKFIHFSFFFFHIFLDLPNLPSLQTWIYTQIHILFTRRVKLVMIPTMDVYWSSKEVFLNCLRTTKSYQHKYIRRHKRKHGLIHMQIYTHRHMQTLTLIYIYIYIYIYIKSCRQNDISSLYPPSGRSSSPYIADVSKSSLVRQHWYVFVQESRREHLLWVRPWFLCSVMHISPVWPK